MLDKIKNWYHEEDIISIPGYDEAILGCTEIGRLIYSRSKMYQILCQTMPEEEADEELLDIESIWEYPIFCYDEF